MPYVNITGSIALEMEAREPWPDDVKMYQPYEIEQILLPDNASCLSVQAFLKMCNLPYEVIMRGNAEFMSPSGRVPFIRCGAFVVPELEPIVQFCSKKGASLTEKLTADQKTDMRAYMSMINNVLVNAELYVTWLDEDTYSKVTYPRNSSVYPWPLGWLQTRSKKATVTKRLKALKWTGKSLEDVLFDVERCCQALSERLDKKDYFYGSSPTEIDALVFGHVMSILSITYPENSVLLSASVRKYHSLVNLTQRVVMRYFTHANPKSFLMMDESTRYQGDRQSEKVDFHDSADEKTKELGMLESQADNEMFGLKPLPSPKKNFRSFLEFSEQSKHLLGLNIFSAGKNTLHNTTVEIILEEIVERALWRTASIEVLQHAKDLKNNNSSSLIVARSEEACKDISTSRMSKLFLLMGEKSKDVTKNLQHLFGVGQSSEQRVSIDNSPPLEYNATESFSDYYLAISSSETSSDLPEYNAPTELEALLFGHIFSIITTPLPCKRLAEVVEKTSPNLIKLVNRIEDTYFKKKP